MQTSLSAMGMLWNPRGAGPTAASANPWIPLVALGMAAAFADYPLLVKLGAAELANARLSATPAGMTSFSILFFLGLKYSSPVLLPWFAWFTAACLSQYIHFVLDLDVAKRDVFRVSVYGCLPLAVERTLAGVISLICGSDCDRFNPLASNLAYFLDAKTTSIFWYEMAKGIDVFAVWAFFCVAWGLAAAIEEPRGRVLPETLVLWLAILSVKSWLLS